MRGPDPRGSDPTVGPLIPLAQLAVGAVRRLDGAGVDRAITDAGQLPGGVRALVVLLAAMVDEEATVGQMLAWCSPAPDDRPRCDPAADASPTGTRARHGTRSRYVAGCRGAACLAAESAYQRRRHQVELAARAAGGCAAELDGSPPDIGSPHGTRSRYNAGCRGAACLAAERAYRATRPPRRQTSAGTVSVLPNAPELRAAGT